MSECVGRRNATAGRTPTQNALVGPTEFTPPDATDTVRQDRLVLSGGWCELGIRPSVGTASGAIHAHLRPALVSIVLSRDPTDRRHSNTVGI